MVARVKFTPKNVGELLSDAAALLRRNLLPIALAVLPFCVVEMLCREGSSLIIARVTRSLAPDVDDPLSLAELLPLGGVYAALIAGSVLAAQLLLAGAITASAEALFGRRLGAQRVLFAGLRHAPAILVTTLLWSLGLGVAVLLPGPLVILALWAKPEAWVAITSFALWGLWAIVVFIVLALRWALWPQAVVLEGLSGLRALRRSTRLMGPDVPFAQSPKLRLSLLLIVYLAVASALQSLFAFPALFAGFSQTPPFSDLSLWSLPLWAVLPLTVLEVLTNAVVMPFNGVLSTLFYYDLRVRYEGFGLDDEEEAQA